MINLADKKFCIKSKITEEIINSNIDAYQIFKYYYPDITYGKLVKSPLRNDDSDPSLGLFKSKIHNKLMFKDFGGKSGDAIRFVKELLNLNYYDALSRIAIDFGLDSFYTISSNISNKKYSSEDITLLPTIDKIKFNEETVINIKSRQWNTYDIKWWQQFGITLDTLKLFNIIPISYYFINDLVFRASKYAYAFREEKDNKVTYKIYQPLAKDKKWFTNHNYTIHQGYEQLPNRGGILFITKSLKDVASLRDVLNIPAIAIQSETVMISAKVMQEYTTRFVDIYTHFDFDNAGIRLANKYMEEYNIIPIFTLDKKCKDFSDFVKKFGIEKTKRFFKNIYGI